MAKESTKKKVVADYVYAVGRRKTATARVRLFLKKGDLIVNEKPAGEYFPGKLAMMKYLEPLKLTGVDGKFSFSAKVHGSGKTAQVGAVAHGLARALAKHDETAYRPILKEKGLLTRDSRMKESRKVGMGGKARRKKQSPKR